MSRTTARRWTIGAALGLAAAAGWTGPLRAQAGPSQPEPRTIRVSAVGEASVAPDEAQLILSVESEGATAQAAGQENAQTMQRVIAALVGAGVPRDSIETRNYSLSPQYATNERGEAPRIQGYRASNQVLVKTTDLEGTGKLIDVALAAGANRFEGVNFLARDTREAQAAALRDATVKARAQAEVIAAALGVRLGQVLDAGTGAVVAPPVPMYRYRMEAADAMAAPTPIQPGQQTVSAQVSIVYEIQNR
jgi:uncharacterized protein YggE